MEEAINWQMQFGANCWMRITSENMAPGSWNLKGLGTLGRLSLKGLFNICVLQLYSLVDQFQPGGPWKGFSPCTLVSSLIIRLNVILYLHLSSLTL